MSWSVRRDLLFIGNIRFIIQIRIYFSIVLATLVRPFTAMGVPRWWHRFSYLVEDLFSVHGMFYIIQKTIYLSIVFIDDLKFFVGRAPPLPTLEYNNGNTATPTVTV